MSYARSSLVITTVVLGCVAALDHNARGIARAEESRPGQTLTLHARTRVQGEGKTFAVRQKTLQWEAGKTALVVCDMWENHYCKGAARRVSQMAPRMNEVITAARKRGVLIIHCPSGGMDHYRDTPQRKLAQLAPQVKTKVPLKGWCHLDKSREAGLPIDDSDGGCDCLPRCKVHATSRRQNEALQIAPGDAITDSAEAFYLMRQRGIENVIVMGVHTNMCILGRPFSIRQMAGQGQNVVLMRDLTDTMYNPRMRPFVSHFRGTELVIEHIEKYWCPTIASTDLTDKAEFAFVNDKRPQVVFVIGEKEYHTKQSLPAFAMAELQPRGIRCTMVHADSRDPNNFPGLAALKTADLMFLSVRRRALSEQQLALVRGYLDAGKPLVAIRTASHAFSLRKGQPVPPGHAEWRRFDADVLGGNYHGHHDNSTAKSPRTYVRAVPEAKGHPILTGLRSDEFPVHSSLYKTEPLAKTATLLMLGRVEDRRPHEPVAWTNTYQDGRVFYTSLGHVKDFKVPAFRRMLLNAVFWALDKKMPEAKLSSKEQGNRQKEHAATPKKEFYIAAEAAESAPSTGESGGLNPEEAAQRFTVADGLQWEQVLAEPLVGQPVFLNFDERGRMWVVHYLQYPFPAGLKVLSRDKDWRTVYDKVPPPPPNHFRGKDKITIHEDTDGDGRYDQHKTFLEGLSLVTSCTRGRGGVWVLNPPYLLFYADQNNDDLPDGDPEVHLAGFGLQDSHSITNSLRWGPDGWLYASQGSTVSADVLRPGQDKTPVHSMGQLIWRYHPEQRRYEIFAEGGGNAFGVEIDAKGRIYSGHNGGDTRGFHYVQGGYFRKGFSKHGPLSNPYAYGYFAAMRHAKVPRFTHNFIIYGGGALGGSYDGKLLGVEPLQGQIVLSDVQPDGSTFKTKDISRPVKTEDTWFRPVDIKHGPDGAVYVADFYDKFADHRNHHKGKVFPDSGRIYRLRAKGAKPAKPSDLGKLSTGQLVDLLSHKNKWHRQTALRLIGDRKDRSVVGRLKKMVRDNTGQLALEALWALNLSGGLSEEFALSSLDHGDPYVRLWTVRIMCDKRRVSLALANKLAGLARAEPHLEVRCQLACSARRLPAVAALPIIGNLLTHSQDIHDLHQPLLLWWALETKTHGNRDAVLELFDDKAIWGLPLVQQHILGRMMRRFASSGSRAELLACARLFRQAPNAEAVRQLMAGFEKAYKGRSLSRLPVELVEQIASAGGGSLTLRIRRADDAAIQEALKIIADDKADVNKRIEYAHVFGEVKEPRSVDVMLEALAGSKDGRFSSAILTALGSHHDKRIGAQVVALHGGLSKDVQTVAQTLLASRPVWSHELLRAIDAKKIDRGTIATGVVHRILLQSDTDNTALVRKHWGDVHGATTAHMQQQIRRLAQVIGADRGNPHDGSHLYKVTCAKCHTLFNLGGKIGPDLTAYKRDDVNRMLLNIVNPSAEIREGFENYLAVTEDGRVLNGFLSDQDQQVIVLRGIDGQNIILPRDEVEELRVIPRSIMPEGLLDTFNDQEIRNLFAFLRSAQPLNDSSTQSLNNQ